MVSCSRGSTTRRARVALIIVAVALCSARVPTQSSAHYAIADLGTLGGPASVGYGISEFGSAMAGQSQTSTGASHAFVQGRAGLKDLGTLGGPQSAAFAVGAGLIVGQADTADGHHHAFSYPMFGSGGMVDLGTLGGAWSAAYGVSDDGTIVGASQTTTTDTRLRAFAYRDGAMSPLAVDLGGDSVARGAATPLIVGYACTSSNASCRAFSYQNGAATMLDSFGGDSVANGVNVNGQIVGASALGDHTTRHAFLFTNGAMNDLGTLGGPNSEAFDINTRGDVVGTSDAAGGGARAFLWRNGVMTDLNTLIADGSGWILQTASAVSDGGQIVGTGLLNGTSRGFLLTPPVNLALFAGGTISQLDSNLPRGAEVGRTITFVISALAATDDGVTVYGARMTDTLTGPAEYVSYSSQTGDTCSVTPSVLTCDLAPIDSTGLGNEIVVKARTTAAGHFSHTAQISSDSNASNASISETNWAVALSTLTLTPSTLAGGKASSARVTLTDIAGPGDALVRLSSSRPDVAPVPSTIDVPSTTTSRAFNIIPKVVAQSTPVEISATYGLVTVKQTLTVVPPVLTQLSLTPTTVVGGCGTSAGKIVLSGSAPDGGATVPLSNTNSMAIVPATVTVPAGASTVAFTVRSKTVTTPAVGSITAAYGGASKTLTFTVRPIRVKTLVLSPNPAAGGTTVSATFTLECAAPAGGIVVSLSSSNTAVAAPTVSSVTVPAGATSGSFSVRTSHIATSTNVSIYATAYGVRKIAALTVNP